MSTRTLEKEVKVSLSRMSLVLISLSMSPRRIRLKDVARRDVLGEQRWNTHQQITSKGMKSHIERDSEAESWNVTCERYDRIAMMEMLMHLLSY
jgi:hypothetical protein